MIPRESLKLSYRQFAPTLGRQQKAHFMPVNGIGDNKLKIISVRK